MCSKRRRLGFNLVQKIFICDNYLQSYARLNALNTENVNSRNSGSKVFIEKLEIFLGYHH